MALVFPHPFNLTTFDKQLAYINSLTDIGYGGSLGIVLLIIIGSVLFMMMKAFSMARAFSIAAIITAIFSIFLRIMGLINNTVMSIFIILAFIGLYLLMNEAEKYE